MNAWLLYALLALSLLLTIASMATLNPALIAASTAFVFAVALLCRMWYIIEAAVFRHTHIVEIFSGYELSGSRETAVRKLHGAFTATAAAQLPINAKNGITREKIEELVQRSHSPFKFVLQVERLGAKRLMNEMQTRLSMKRLALSRIDTSSSRGRAKSDSLGKEIQELEDELSILRASAPMRLRNYLMTSAMSDSRFSASDRALTQLKDLANRFGVLLGAEPVLLSGAELLSLLELDSTMME